MVSVVLILLFKAVYRLLEQVHEVLMLRPEKGETLK